MKKLLLTAFEPYGDYASNASLETLRSLEARLPIEVRERILFRTYPVEFETIGWRLEDDLDPTIGCTILMGQAPRRATIDFESVGRNVGRRPGTADDALFELDVTGPEAFSSGLPLDEWAAHLRDIGLPATVSSCAGTYLCNAATYWALRCLRIRGQAPAATFLHLPCATELLPEDPATLPLETLIVAAQAAVGLALEWIDEEEDLDDDEPRSL